MDNLQSIWSTLGGGGESEKNIQFVFFIYKKILIENLYKHLIK
jgi:hypothetical protein